jgi:signal transduction histidine kinase
MFIFAIMKLSLKHIVILVIVALTIIFAYQAYWLTGLYTTMQSKIKSDIKETVRLSDYDEVFHRIAILRKEKKRKHGRMDINVEINANDHSATVKNQSHLKDNTEESKCATSTEIPNLDFSSMLRNPKGIMKFEVYMQQGIHSGLDLMKNIDIRYFNKLLNRRLDSLGINTPHQLLYIHYDKKDGEKKVLAKTIASFGDSSYKYTDTLKLSLNPTNTYSYVLLTPPITTVVLRQMSGILVTSLIILIILIFVFYYLIHTIMKQKTLDEMKSDFTNNMTHELKTPIAVAYAANDVLLNFNGTNDTEKTKKYLSITQEQLKRLSGLVEQILYMSMERRKTMSLKIEDVDVLGVIQHLVAQQKLKADKPVDITIDIQNSLTVKADFSHFSNIISNLLDNAVKYSKEKAVILITANRCDDFIEIDITDHGIGIEQDKQKYIFDKFYRVPHGNVQNVKGYGLGLYYVKSMMDKFNGSIDVESEPSKGTTFKLRFNG